MDKRSDKEKKKSRSSLSARIISTTVFSYLFFGTVIGVIGFCIFRKFFGSEYEALLYYIGSILIAAIVFAAVESFLFSRYVKKQFVKPIEEISEEAVRFANENTVKEPFGDVSRIDELSALAGAIDVMEIKMTDYAKDLSAA